MGKSNQEPKGIGLQAGGYSKSRTLEHQFVSSAYNKTDTLMNCSWESKMDTGQWPIRNVEEPAMPAYGHSTKSKLYSKWHEKLKGL